MTTFHLRKKVRLWIKSRDWLPHCSLFIRLFVSFSVNFLSANNHALFNIYRQSMCNFIEVLQKKNVKGSYIFSLAFMSKAFNLKPGMHNDYMEFNVWRAIFKVKNLIFYIYICILILYIVTFKKKMSHALNIVMLLISFTYNEKPILP